MERVTDARAYEYDTELVVELLCEDDRGEVAVVSYQFDVVDDLVTPRGEIAPAHRDQIEAAITDIGYDLR